MEYERFWKHNTSFRLHYTLLVSLTHRCVWIFSIILDFPSSTCTHDDTLQGICEEEEILCYLILWWIKLIHWYGCILFGGTMPDCYHLVNIARHFMHEQSNIFLLRMSLMTHPVLNSFSSDWLSPNGEDICEIGMSWDRQWESMNRFVSI